MLGRDTPACGGGVERLVLLRPRPRQRAMEDVAAGHPQRGLQVGGRPRFDAGRPVRRFVDAVRDRLRDHRIEGGLCRGEQLGARGIRIPSRQQAVRRVESEEGQRLRSRCAQVGPENRRVGERVAVDLRRERTRDAAARGDVVGPVELRHGLVDVEGSAEGRLGADGGVVEPGEPAQQHVDLDLGAFGRGVRGRVPAARADEGGEHGGSDAAQHEAPAERRCVVDRHLAVGRDRGDLGAGAQVGSGIPCRSFQLRGDAAHAAHGHVPVPGSAADHVVEEAAILAEARLVAAGEGADQPVGQCDALSDVAAQ